MTCRECDQPATMVDQCKYHYRREGRELKKRGFTRRELGTDRHRSIDYDDFWRYIRDELKIPEAQPK